MPTSIQPESNFWSMRVTRPTLRPATRTSEPTSSPDTPSSIPKRTTYRDLLLNTALLESTRMITSAVAAAVSRNAPARIELG